MRMSKLVGRRIKEDPKDAKTVSHKFLVRGGYVRPVSAGIYSLLPLGTARGVSIRGCYYLIDDYTLESDTSRGMSNVGTADEAVITVREGDLLLFHYSDIHGHGESA